MDERRTSKRERVMLTGFVDTGKHGTRVDCQVRNLSDDGATVELATGATIPDQVSFAIPSRGRSLLARIVWWRAGKAGLAFAPPTATARELEDQLRASERKAKRLKRRVAELLNGH